MCGGCPGRRFPNPYEAIIPKLSPEGVSAADNTLFGSWKVKRIRRDPRVLVARSSFRGRERGARLEGLARIVDDVDVQGLMRGKYGWQKRLLERLNRGKPDTSVTIAIVEP